MKKFKIIMIAVLLFNMFSGLTFAQPLKTDEEIIDKFLAYSEIQTIEEKDAAELMPEQKLYCTATAQDSFELGEVIVVLTREQSANKQQYTAADFPNINVTEVNTLYDYYPEYENNIILLLKIGGVCKQDVIDTIAVLEQDDRIISAEPDYTFTAVAGSTNDSGIMPYLVSDDLTNERSADLHTYACCARKYTDANKNNTVKVGIVDVGIYSNIPGVSNRVVQYVDFVDQIGYTVAYSPPSDYNYHGTNVASVIVKPEETRVETHDICGENIYCGVCKNVDLDLPLE